jgi:hypothetical protein
MDFLGRYYKHRASVACSIRSTIKEIRKVVGPRERSSFLVEAAWEKLERMKLTNALKESAGAWSSELHPDLQTQEDINKWLRSLRQEDSERLKGSTIEDISAGQ